MYCQAMAQPGGTGRGVRQSKAKMLIKPKR